MRSNPPNMCRFCPSTVHVFTIAIDDCGSWQTRPAPAGKTCSSAHKSLRKVQRVFPKSGSWIPKNKCQESRNTAAHSCILISLLKGSFHIPLGYTGPCWWRVRSLRLYCWRALLLPKQLVWSNKLRWLMVYVVTTLQDSGSAALRNN